MGLRQNYSASLQVPPGGAYLKPAYLLNYKGYGYDPAVWTKLIPIRRYDTKHVLRNFVRREFQKNSLRFVVLKDILLLLRFIHTSFYLPSIPFVPVTSDGG